MVDTGHSAGGVLQWLRSLDSGWRAVALGLVALVAVSLGVPIPW